jgi:hypothetical protein
MRKYNSALLWYVVVIKIWAFVTMCYKCMRALSTGFWVLRTETLCDSFLHLCISLTFVTTMVLLQRAENMKVTWCQDPTKSDRWHPCRSSLVGCVSNGHWLGTKWHSSLQSSEEASWWSQIPKCCGIATYSGCVRKAQNSVLMAYILS